MSLRRLLAAAAASAFVLSLGATSQAFCLTHTCDPGENGTNCPIDKGCNVGGLVLFWPTRTISYSIQKDDSAKAGISREALGAVVENAFQRWAAADCGGQSPSFAIERLPAAGKDGPEYVDCPKPEYNKSQGNANVITFHDDTWPYKNTGAETLALTTVFFNPQTGEIYDANIEINTSQPEHNRFVVGTPRASDVDLNAVLTHETGHFLGLSHSTDTSATMWSSYEAGMTTLERDDVSAICASLAPGRMFESTSTVPRHGFDAECGKPDSGCCNSTIGSKPPSSTGLWVFGLGLSAWLGRARFRRRLPTARAPRR